MVAEPPDGDDWLHEVKFDGYRLQCLVDRTRVRLLTRSGADWTARFPRLAAWLAGRGWSRIILDGEVVVLDERGRSDFQLLQARLADGEAEVVVYYAFDLLRQGTTDLRPRALPDRKAALRRLLGGSRARGAVRYSDHVMGSGGRVLQESCRQGLEGIISKRADAAYQSGRSRTWLKTKCVAQQEFVVIGFTPPKGTREGIGALLLAARDGSGRLRYAGRVGSGFSVPLLRQLRTRLLRALRDAAPIAPVPAVPAGTRWVHPRVVVEVRFTEWTEDGLLRHPTFLGVREDKMATQVKQERPARSRFPMLTHPDKVLYAEQGLTKEDLARYYQRIAPLMLPHLAGRPLSLVRCPEGSSGSCFFQKHLTGRFPEALRRVSIRQSNGVRPYAVVEDLEGLLALVQMGVLELHLWGATADRIEAPDRLVFDLDPGDGLAWPDLCKGAGEVRDFLAELGLQSWVKTSGGKGVHVVVPIERRSSWEAAAAFARSVARALEEHAPERYLSRAAKAARSGKIFVDWLRNTRGATTVAAWSTRARTGAAVSHPCAWNSLLRFGGADTVTVASVLRDGPPVRQDPWAAMLKTRQRLPAAHR